MYYCPMNEESSMPLSLILRFNHKMENSYGQVIQQLCNLLSIVSGVFYNLVKYNCVIIQQNFKS